MNITKYIEPVISQSNIILENFMEAIPDLIWSVDLDYNFIAFNKRFQIYYYSITGKKIQKGMNFFEYIPEKYFQFWEITFQKVLKNEIFSIEQSFLALDSKYYFELSFNTIKFNPKEIVGIFIYGRDITKRKSFEEKLKSQEDLKLAITEAEYANQAKINFLSNVSHELRTPINSIIGFTELINNDERLPTDIKKYSEALLKNANHLIDLTNDLIDLSKIEAGKMELAEDAFYLDQLVYSIQDMFFLECEKKEVRLSISLSDQIPKIILGDKKRLKQILFNLIGNAVKFTPKGEVCVSIKLMSVNKNKFLNRRIYKLRFEVKDNGLGFPEDKIQSIFKPFEQAKIDNKGSGLGLSISSLLVKMMGGEINIWSKENQGSCFWFEIFVKTLTDIEKSNHNNGITEIPNQESIEKHTINNQPIIKVKEILNTLSGLPFLVFKSVKESIEVQDFHKLNTILDEIQPGNNKEMENLNNLKSIINDYDFYMIKLISDSLE